ncbi:hypothetical protein [Actinophytocola xanthii]|uniref:Uncharacterized protein n=1 Tax=Actinophytocola xanthii TaxID=1912961 RepID=A0A1Q8CLS5_9PSEU|nr:hypothetical protein [Actinophytocola xanthii]OLF15316.1 hypothetical protein BU204_22945 [Actinophytocola xanthii]
MELEITQVLARFWGLVLVVSCGAALVNARARRTLLDAKETEAFTLAVGWLALVIGAAHVALYNEWTLGHAGVITFLGWITLLRAAFRLVFPAAATRATRQGRKRMAAVHAYTALALLLGIYLLLVGLGVDLP